VESWLSRLLVLLELLSMRPRLRNLSCSWCIIRTSCAILGLSKYQVQPRLHRSISSPHRTSSMRQSSLPRGSEQALCSRDEASSRPQNLAAPPLICLRPEAEPCLRPAPSSRRRCLSRSFIALYRHANARKVSHCSPRPMHPQALRVSYPPKQSVSLHFTSPISPHH